MEGLHRDLFYIGCVGDLREDLASEARGLYDVGLAGSGEEGGEGELAAGLVELVDLVDLVLELSETALR